MGRRPAGNLSLAQVPFKVGDPKSLSLSYETTFLPETKMLSGQLPHHRGPPPSSAIRIQHMLSCKKLFSHLKLYFKQSVIGKKSIHRLTCMFKLWYFNLSVQKCTFVCQSFSGSPLQILHFLSCICHTQNASFVNSRLRFIM